MCGILLSSVLPGLLSLTVSMVIQLLLLTTVLAMCLPYCSRAANGEVVRFRNLRDGLRTHWLGVFKVLAVYMILGVILIVNFNFYMAAQGSVESSGVKVLMVTITALTGWTALGCVYFIGPWLAAITSAPAALSARAAFRKGLIAIALTPSTWLFLGFFLIFMLGFGFYTRIGMILIMPFFVSLVPTAYFLSVQYAAFLTDARAELGDDKPLRAYKKRAMELGQEWEYQQPRRTAKELIRPWDY